MTACSLTGVTHRPVQGRADAMRLRQLLIDSYAIVGREFNWETRRWEGSYWCVRDADLADPLWGAHTEIWENGAGEVLGAAIPDGPGDVAIQVHPDCRALEDALLDWAEEHIAHPIETGQRELIAWSFNWDTERQERLARRGHVLRDHWFWHHRRRPIADPVPVLPIAEGYVIRSVRPEEADVTKWIACTNIVFGQRLTPDYHRNFQQHSPSHNYDLHIVAVAPDGSFGAFSGLTGDAINRYATFEPVGTHPDHRRKGLARIVMFEGLRRLQELGSADVAYVANWGTADAGALYASVGLEHYATNNAWVKTI